MERGKKTGWGCEVGIELGQPLIAPAFHHALGRWVGLRSYHPTPQTPENKPNDVVI